MDKFKTFGLTPVAASVVAARSSPSVCQSGMQGEGSKAGHPYNFFHPGVVKAWIDPRRKRPRTIHHQEKACLWFRAGRSKLPSQNILPHKMKRRKPEVLNREETQRTRDKNSKPSSPCFLRSLLWKLGVVNYALRNFADRF